MAVSQPDSVSRLELIPITIDLCLIETIEDSYEYRLESVSATSYAMA